jgi:hypothetical protein
MHIDETLKILDDVTTEMGTKFRAFSAKTCSTFNTRELPRETAARKRRRLKKKDGKKVSMDPSAKSTEAPDGPRPRRFNLQIYKYHVLCDYPKTIRMYGTSDSYSTEPVKIQAT